MIILGFDPGGIGRFGWCVAEGTPAGELWLCEAGVADHAAGAVSAALNHAGDPRWIRAAGIDSPLFWVADGDRRAERSIRAAMTRLGAKNVGGTVQQVNSLRGACLVQGIMATRLLRQALPTVGVTESHPKALLWLLKIANEDRRVAEVTITHLSEFVKVPESLQLSDHQRDAALGAVGAWAMVTRPAGWRDLFQDEEGAFVPVAPVEYWMPISDTPPNTRLHPTAVRDVSGRG